MATEKSRIYRYICYFVYFCLIVIFVIAFCEIIKLNGINSINIQIEIESLLVFDSIVFGFQSFFTEHFNTFVDYTKILKDKTTITIKERFTYHLNRESLILNLSSLCFLLIAVILNLIALAGFESAFYVALFLTDVATFLLMRFLISTVSGHIKQGDIVITDKKVEG